MFGIRNIVRHHRAFGWATIAAVSVLIAAALLWLAPRMAPARRGDSATFWKAALRVELNGPSNRLVGPAHCELDGWYYYEEPHFHGTHLYRVPVDEALADFGRVSETLRAAGDDQNIPSYVRAGFEKWSERPAVEQSPEVLFADVKTARREYWKIRNPDLLARADQYEQEVVLCCLRTRWYWATLLFEWLYLSGLVLFAAWPWVRGQGWRGWAIRAGLLPLLFMLPVYLGYAATSFTSAGPSGGVLYPWLLRLVQGYRCNDLDRLILSHMPPVLEPLSPSIGPALVLSGRGMPGPTTALLLGALAAAGVFAIEKVRNYSVRRYRPSTVTPASL